VKAKKVVKWGLGGALVYQFLRPKKDVVTLKDYTMIWASQQILRFGWSTINWMKTVDENATKKSDAPVKLGQLNEAVERELMRVLRLQFQVGDAFQETFTESND
jgi:hypothetical protein